MQKGIKFRIYPNKEQQNIIHQTLGCCRLIYNKGLAMRNEAYEKGDKVGYSQTSAMLTGLKKSDDFAFLKVVDSIALQQSLRDLDRGFVNFFQKRASHPTFKSKHNRHQSYRTINQGDNIRIAGKYLKLPKLGYVKARQSMEIGKIHNVTIEHTPTGKYFAVLNVEFEPQPMPNKGGMIGIDVGIKEFYSDSNGNVVSNPKYLEKSMRKLMREQRKLSRKEKGSGNRNKQRVKVALVHEKITNQRKDFLQKQSTMLIRENQTICIEDLKVKNMMRNHKLAQHIGSVSWSKFFDMLIYKSVWYGNDVVKVPTMYPSSQTCSACGYKNPLVKNLAIRSWMCPECGTKHNRDTNASINILNKGLQIQSAYNIKLHRRAYGNSII
ncbi:MAG: IS200/IS605 family element RNA-guided endonuclease TnpB [Faecalimonas umbilicata]